MKRVGILGGSFDPPHVAHAAMAVRARDALGLDAVVYMPAPSPPHKTAAELSPYEHRVQMTELAAAAAGVDVSRFEERRSGPSFTVDLVREYRAATGNDVYFIVGADSLRDLPTWRDPAGMLASCTLVVFPRDGIPLFLAVEGDAALVVFEAPEITVSSTAIRERVQEGRSIDEMVPPAVAAYIHDHRLYTPSA